MRHLIDTNVISELMRREPDPRVVEWSLAQDGFMVGVVTLEELVSGLTRKALGFKLQWLEEFLSAHCEILPVNAKVARTAGLLRGQLAARGKVRHASDMLIAGTALVHGLALATRNTSDFEGCGITLVNPFTCE